MYHLELTSKLYEWFLSIAFFKQSIRNEKVPQELKKTSIYFRFLVQFTGFIKRYSVFVERYEVIFLIALCYCGYVPSSAITDTSVPCKYNNLQEYNYFESLPSLVTFF
jgi:hypothetical protein